jgi:hypothetical protein
VAEFNIAHSKIEQVNDTGANYKVANNSAPVTVSGGDSVQTIGTGQTVRASLSERQSVVAKLWGWVRRAWNWMFGKPA